MLYAETIDNWGPAVFMNTRRLVLSLGFDFLHNIHISLHPGEFNLSHLFLFNVYPMLDD